MLNYKLDIASQQWCDEEDGLFIDNLSDKEEQNLDYDEGVFIRAKIYHSPTFIEIRWRGFGIRRGVMFMDSIYCHPIELKPETAKINNWLIGFTAAGNGTPAYMFPVNNEASYDIAQRILVTAIV